MISKEIEPMYYAVIRLFVDKHSRTMSDVFLELASKYATQRLFTTSGINDVLLAACANGLLSEVDYSLDEKGSLVVHYQITEFGIGTVKRYLKQ